MPIAIPHRREARIIGGLDTLAGLWLFLSSFIFAADPRLAWNLAITGFVVAVFAGARALGYRRAWPSWINLLLGLWTAASPWVLTPVPNTGAVWDAVVTG